MGVEKRRQAISANTFITLQDTQADLKIVEHTGQAIDAGRDDIIDTLEQMATLSMQPLIRKPTANAPTGTSATATEKLIDADMEFADLAVMARDAEDAFSTVLYFMGLWDGVEVPESKMVTLHTDFGITGNDAQDLSALLALRATRQITQATLLKEFLRRKRLDPTMDVLKEIALTLNEGLSLDALNPKDPPPVDPNAPPKRKPN